MFNWYEMEFSIWHKKAPILIWIIVNFFFFLNWESQYGLNYCTLLTTVLQNERMTFQFKRLEFGLTIKSEKGKTKKFDTHWNWTNQTVWLFHVQHPLYMCAQCQSMCICWFNSLLLYYLVLCVWTCCIFSTWKNSMLNCNNGKCVRYQNVCDWVLFFLLLRLIRCENLSIEPPP